MTDAPSPPVYVKQEVLDYLQILYDFRQQEAAKGLSTSIWLVETINYWEYLISLTDG